MASRTRYTKAGGVNIAYQVVGDGPVDLVFAQGWATHLELAWEIPAMARFLQSLASFSRLILFDKRGTGLSDRFSPEALPTLEERMSDLHAVMDAAGSERPVLFGTLGGAAMAGLFAASYPERTRALIVYGAFAKLGPTRVCWRVCPIPARSPSPGSSRSGATRAWGSLRGPRT